MRRLIILFLLAFPAWSVQTRYVNTDSSAGGDCTTNATTGDSRACATLSAAEALMGASISEPWEIIVSGTQADTAAATFNVATTGTNTITITAAAGYRAKSSGWDTNIYRLSVSNSLALYMQTNYVIVDGLQIEAYDIGSSLSVVGTSVAAGGSLHQFSNCRVRADADATYTVALVALNDPDSTSILVYNNILYARSDNQGTVDGLLLNGVDTSTAYAYNNTIYNVRRGVRDSSDAARVNVYDSAVFATSGNDFYGGAAAFNAVDYCASDDNIGTNNVAESGGGAAWPDDFEDAANGDFRLKSTSNLVGAAGEAGSGSFSVDIDGSTRADWDVGADEYVAASSVRKRVIIPTR